MIAGTVGAMAAGDTLRYAQIASLAAFTVAVLSFFAWLLRLSALVKLISDSILWEFKAGAGLAIAMTQLPSLFGVAGGGHNFFERAYLFVGQLGQTQVLILLVGLVALVLLVAGERLLPGRPIALGVVVLAIAAATVLPGCRRSAFPSRAKFHRVCQPWPHRLCGYATSRASSRWRVAVCCWLILRACPRLVPLRRSTATRSMHARSSSVSAPPISQRRLDGLSGCWWIVAVGRQRQGRRALRVGAPLRLGHAGLVPAFSHGAAGEASEGRSRRNRPHRGVWTIGFPGDAPHVAGQPARLPSSGDRAPGRALARNSRHPARGFGFYSAAARARIAAPRRLPRRTPGTEQYSDMERHPNNEPVLGVIVFRPEASLIYTNANSVLQAVLSRVQSTSSPIRLVVCDLSASPFIDLAGSRMLHELEAKLSSGGIALRIVGAHGRVRDLLRADGLGGKVGGIDRTATVEKVLLVSVRQTS